jgi:hypothetical protein
LLLLLLPGGKGTSAEASSQVPTPEPTVLGADVTASIPSPASGNNTVKP